MTAEGDHTANILAICCDGSHELVGAHDEAERGGIHSVTWEPRAVRHIRQRVEGVCPYRRVHSLLLLQRQQKWSSSCRCQALRMSLLNLYA